MDNCDNCGEIRELYHNEASGLSYCWDCDIASQNEAADEAEIGPFHAELRQVISVIDSANELAAYSAEAEERDAEENGEENHIVLSIRAIQESNLGDLRAQAEALLALPEESVAALVAAAQSMTEAASFGR